MLSVEPARSIVTSKPRDVAALVGQTRAWAKFRDGGGDVCDDPIGHATRGDVRRFFAAVASDFSSKPAHRRLFPGVAARDRLIERCCHRNPRKEPSCYVADGIGDNDSKGVNRGPRQRVPTSFGRRPCGRLSRIAWSARMVRSDTAKTASRSARDRTIGFRLARFATSTRWGKAPTGTERARHTRTIRWAHPAQVRPGCRCRWPVAPRRARASRTARHAARRDHAGPAHARAESRITCSRFIRSP